MRDDRIDFWVRLLCRLFACKKAQSHGDVYCNQQNFHVFISFLCELIKENHLQFFLVIRFLSVRFQT